MGCVSLLPQSRPLTRDDLDALPDDGHRYELIDGALIVTPAPSRTHQTIVGELFVLLHAACPHHLQVLLAPFDVVLRTLNEPLGALVTLWPLQKTVPSFFSDTSQVCPLRFWSTSNSTSMRPSSGLSLSFQSDVAVQEPALTTSPDLASTAPGATLPTAAATDRATPAAPVSLRPARILESMPPPPGVGPSSPRRCERTRGA